MKNLTQLNSLQHQKTKLSLAKYFWQYLAGCQSKVESCEGMTKIGCVQKHYLILKIANKIFILELSFHSKDNSFLEENVNLNHLTEAYVARACVNIPTNNVYQKEQPFKNATALCHSVKSCG